MATNTVWQVARAGAQTAIGRAVCAALYRDDNPDRCRVAVEEMRRIVGNDPAGLADLATVEEIVNRLQGVGR